MTFTSNFFITKTFLSSSNPICLPDGTHAPITHIGTLSLSPDLSLSNVLCDPSFHHNLLSVSALAKDLNCFVIFYLDHCVLQDLHSKRKIGPGKLHGGLHILEPTNPSVFAMTNSDSIDLTWHWRLGHLSSSRFSSIIQTNNYVSFNKSCFCPVCPLAKHSRLPFPHSSTATSFPFELIHVDVWGAYSIPSLCGAHYFFTIVDDFTRSTWLYLMQYKSETSHFLKLYINMCKTQFQTSVRTIRSDNGT